MSYSPVRAFALCFLVLGGLLCLAPAPAHAQFGGDGGNPFKPPEATIHYARTRDYHVQHLKLVFDIDAVSHSAHGVVTHTLAPLREGLTRIVMDAGANLKIEGCRLAGYEVHFTHDKNTLTVEAPSPLSRDTPVALEIRYTMPGGRTGGGANGLGGFHWIDPRPTNPDRRPAFWTQGESNTNSNWVPCYDYPNDKCTSETITTVPDNWIVIGNGAEGPVTHDATRHTRTYRWTMTQPHSTYLLSLVGGELDVKKSSWRGVPLYYVVPRGEADLIEGSFGNTPDMLSFFSDTLGVKYAWPKYAQSAMFDFGGGMENVSATTLGAFSLTDMRSGKYAMSSLNSHELAHQWFGDLVTCKDWGDIWLNESFATFFEMLYMEHLNGKEQYDREMESNIQGYLRGATRVAHPLSTKHYSNPDAMFEQSHTYDKGGAILAMLRYQLGDADLFRALGHYLKTHAYQPVDAHDLEKSIAEETGVNVEPFFDQWIFKPGHPVLDMTWSYDDTGKTVVVHVKQQQDTSDGTPIYDTPLVLELIQHAPGSTLSWQRVMVTLNKADQEFRLPANRTPDAVLLDPDHGMLKEVKELHWDDSALPSILLVAPCCLDRRRAADRLATNGVNDATKQLFVDALKTEGTAYVGAYLISKLGELKDPALGPLLREQATSKQPERRAAALAALGGLPRDDQDIAILKAAAVSDTEPDNVVENAMPALGKLDAIGNLEAFRHQIHAKSRRDRLARTAVRTLGASGQDTAVPVLLEATAPSHTADVREAAIESLTKLAPNNPVIHTQLLALLKDTNADVQQAAITALKDRNDKAAVPELRALATSATDNDVKQAASDAADNLSK